MTEKRLFVKADESCSDRFLYPDEMFRKVKNFNGNLPETRQFKNGECIVTDKDDTAYSIDELINLLNYFNRLTVPARELEELRKENEELNQYKILVKSLKEQNQKLKLRLKDLGVEY